MFSRIDFLLQGTMSSFFMQ